MDFQAAPDCTRGMNNKSMEAQVVSKQRVADHGEVLTGKREVNAMLDLVKQETERIDSRFIESKIRPMELNHEKE